MSNLVIYDAERDAGLTDLILASSAIEMMAEVTRVTDSSEQLKMQLRGGLNNKIIATNLGQPDLHYLSTVLVSVGWNNNDDVFLKEEVFAARHTPEDKPFNYEHNQNDIIGHITGCSLIDDDGLTLADDIDLSMLPDSFHIKTSAVLYKHWEDDAKAERIEKIIKEIADDQWFVSMEALMTNFDYALRDVNTKENKIIARNKSTAFLTKHLRRFKGTGRFENYEVGRILRHITFAGKGLVRRPANNKSVILTSTAHTLFNCVDANLQMETDIMPELTVTELSKEIASLNREIVKANEERDEAKKALAQVNSEQTAVKIQSLESAVAARDEKIAELTSKATSLQADLDATVKAKSEANDYEKEAKKKYEEASAKILELESQIKSHARIASFVEAGYDKELAESTVKSLASLNDEQFNAVVALAKKNENTDSAKAAKEEEEKKNKKEEEEKAKAALDAAKAETTVPTTVDTPTKVLAAKLTDDLSALIKDKFFTKTTASSKNNK